MGVGVWMGGAVIQVVVIHFVLQWFVQNLGANLAHGLKMNVDKIPSEQFSPTNSSPEITFFIKVKATTGL